MAVLVDQVLLDIIADQERLCNHMDPSRTVSRGSWKVPTICEIFPPPRSGTACSAPLPSWGPPATSRPGALGRGDRRGRWLRRGTRPDKLRDGPTETRR